MELTDDRGLQPAENITPLVRAEVVERWGADVVAVIDAVSAHLTTAAVRDLDRAAADRRPPPCADDRRRSGGRRCRRDARCPPSERARDGDGRHRRRDRPGGRRHGRRSRPPSGGHVRRRPSGAPPPLPRSIGRTGRGWLVALVVLVAWLVVALLSPWARRVTDQVDASSCARIAALRTDWLTTLARGIDRMATGWTMSIVAGVLLVATVVFRRWRHLFTFLGSVIVLEILGILLIAAYQRPRPYDVTIIGRWQGFSLPSATAAVVSFTVVGVDLHARRARPTAAHRQGRRHGRGRVVVGGPPVPRRRPSLRRPRRRRPRRGDPAQRVPVLHAQRGRARHATTAARPPTSTSAGAAARRSGAPSRTSSASPSSTSGRSAWPGPAARRRCGCASPAIPTRTCSGSSTR